jgi:ubiquinone biosynthesis protein UbiJ
MERTIEKAEEQVERCRRAVDEPDVASDHEEVQRRWEQLEEARKHVEALYDRWQELEVKAD